MAHATPSPLPAYLERYPEQGGPVERVSVEKLPFTIGRSETADHRVYSSPVSKLHASIVQVAGRYAVRDLQSTNGTFVNGARVKEQLLDDGDIIHLAHVEFCFRESSSPAAEAAASPEPAVDTTQALSLARPASLIRGAARLREMIDTHAVATIFEPIVDLETKEIVGFEALSRGRHAGLPTSPTALLGLAEQCGMVMELSQVFRRLSVAASRQLPIGPRLFLNVHPREIADPGFATSLEVLPQLAGDRRLVVEIAESSVTSAEIMAGHRAALTKLDIELAYDDFGSGYARLIELTDVPPAYLKLDRSLIDGIEAPARQEMISALVRVAESLNVRVIAEGIETKAAAALCAELGCELGQGHLFVGAPALPRRKRQPEPRGRRSRSATRTSRRRKR
jgi:EAL domain-containing protein (putative c-di-GMP-specific phosphodiesterase class I)